MASCKKCGAKVKKPNREGWFKCKHCGPIRPIQKPKE